MMTDLKTKFQAAFRRKPLGFRIQVMLILVSLSIICIGLISFIGYSVTNKLNKELVLNSLQAQIDGTYNLIDSAVNTSIKNYLGAIAEIDAEIVESYYARFKSG